MSGKFLNWLLPANSMKPMLLDESQFNHRHVLLGSQVLLALQRITAISQQHNVPSQFLESVVQMLQELTNFPLIAIELYNPSVNQLTIAAKVGQPIASQDNRLVLSESEPKLSLAKQVLTLKKTLIHYPRSSSTQNLELAFPFHAEEESQVGTLIKVPMLVNQYVVGILDLAHPDHLSDANAIGDWALSLASYIGSLSLNQQLDQQRDSYVRRLDALGLTCKGFSYDWDLESGDVERLPEISKVFELDKLLLQANIDEWLQQIHPADRATVNDFYQGILNHDGNFDLTYRICNPQGQPIEVQEQGTVIRSEVGVPLRVIGQITGHPSGFKPMDAMLSESRTQQQHLTQVMLDNIKTVIFNTDLEGHWVYLNPAWEALTGFTVAESLGQHFTDVVVPEDRQNLLDALQTILDGQTDSYSQEVRLATKIGQDQWFSVEMQATLSETGDLVGTYGSFHNISVYKDVEAQLLQNAFYDSLTGLPNRVLFMERLRQSYRAYRRNHHSLFAVMFLDLDDFKRTNDTYGHLVGDQLLVEVAQRLQDCLRPGDTTARLGGDEFTVLLPQISSKDDVAIVADRVISSLRRPFSVSDEEVYTSATLGLSVCGHPYEQPEDLLRNADIALYQAKASGKGQYAIFSPSMHSFSRAAVEAESDVRQALERKEFEVYFQPILNLTTGSLTGFEALLRWQHPTKGLLHPTDFLSLTEENGLIVPLGWQVLESACKHLKKWQQKTPNGEDISVSVNLSVQQLRSPEVVSRVQTVLASTGVAAHCLKLELSHHILTGTHENLRLTLENLKAVGVQLCLDQFSSFEISPSLTALGGLAFDEIKLDPNLILTMGDENTLEVIRSLISLGHKFGCKVLTAGIETPQQLALLRAFKCDGGQGFWFYHVLSAAAIETRWDDFFVDQDEQYSALAPAILMRTETQQSQLSLFGRQSWPIGRSTDCAIVLPDRWVSRYHADLQCLTNGDVYFVDLGSGNGSFINDERVLMPVQLKQGDRITVGQTNLEFIMPQNPPLSDTQLTTGLTSPKTVLMIQSSKIQGEVWREALTSQGISLIWLQPSVDLVQLLEHRNKISQPMPDLLLLDMTVIKPNPYSFCRWCSQEYDDLNIILTSGDRNHVPSSERQWAINQGAIDLLGAFPEQNIFSNMVEVVAKVKIVLNALGLDASDQGSLSQVLMSLKSSMNRATLHLE